MILRLSRSLLVVLATHGTLTAGLVGHWKFDEGEGTSYADSSANGNDAFVPEGGAEWTMDVPPTGTANTASLVFDGLVSYVETPFTGIGGNAPRTVAFWIKTNSAGAHGLVAWGVSTINGQKWHIRLNNAAGNGPVGAIRTESQGDFTIGTTPLNDGQWHHVASVYPEGGGELGTVLHYVDGVLETAGGNNLSVQAVNTSTTGDPVTIGRRTQGAAQNYFPGQLDDVRIYDRALTGQEVNDLMGAAPSAAGLVFHAPFEEGAGTAIDDVGSGDNDGTLISPEAPRPSWSTDAPPHLEHSLLFANARDLLNTDFPGIGGTASRSVTFWFKTELTGDNGILAWGNSGGSGLKWHARINTSVADGPVGALRLEIQEGRTVATTPVNDGEWHHAAIVFEEDADPDLADVLFYLDGELDPVSLFTSVPIDTQIEGAGARPVTLGGRDQTGAIRGFAGNLADMRIYDSGLSQEEVQAIMFGQAPAPPLQLEVSSAGTDLTIAWDSVAGKRYTLRSATDPAGADPINWPVFGGFENLTATPPRNALTFPRPADPLTLFVVEEFPAPPVAVFSDNFDGADRGWTTGLDASDTEGNTEWQSGNPAGGALTGPEAAFSAPNCFGTNLLTDYGLNSVTWLRTPPIDLSGVAEATVSFQQWVDIDEFLDNDFASLRVLEATGLPGTVTELAVLASPVNGLNFAGWEEFSAGIPSDVLGGEVVLEFRFTSDGDDFVQAAGWYIDDVVVTVPGS